jgi:hypothetical protein
MLQPKDQIIALRAAIRYHRGQVSDFRCWVDDIRIYEAAGLLDQKSRAVPAPAEFLQRCSAFWDNRQRPAEVGNGSPATNSEGAALRLPDYSDADLETLSNSQIEDLLAQMKDAVSYHYGRGYLLRDHADDQRLYSLLPENELWTSALPARDVFLKNCQRFCDHCQQKPEDLLDWGGVGS